MTVEPLELVTYVGVVEEQYLTYKHMGDLSIQL